MSDTPNLWVRTWNPKRLAVDERQASVAEVVVWLREQEVGEVREYRPGYDQLSFGYGLKAGRYLVIPLDTEPPKETE